MYLENKPSPNPISPSSPNSMKMPRHTTRKKEMYIIYEKEYHQIIPPGFHCPGGENPGLKGPSSFPPLSTEVSVFFLLKPPRKLLEPFSCLPGGEGSDVPNSASMPAGGGGGGG